MNVIFGLFMPVLIVASLTWLSLVVADFFDDMQRKFRD